MEQYDDLEWAIAERAMMNLPLVGPLTKEQQEGVDAYEAYHAEEAQEHEAREASGGRTICPVCGHRSVTHRSVITLGHVGHPGAEYSDLASCERCPYRGL